MKRSALKRGKPIKRSRPRWSVEDEARKLWREGLDPRCAMAGQRHPDGTKHRCFGPVDCHHVLPAQQLRKHGHADLEWDRRNRMPLCRSAHTAHHDRRWPVPRALVPGSALEMAFELDLVYLLERMYPEASRLNNRDRSSGSGKGLGANGRDGAS